MVWKIAYLHLDIVNHFSNYIDLLSTVWQLGISPCRHSLFLLFSYYVPYSASVLYLKDNKWEIRCVHYSYLLYHGIGAVLGMQHLLSTQSLHHEPRQFTYNDTSGSIVWLRHISCHMNRICFWLVANSTLACPVCNYPPCLVIQVPDYSEWHHLFLALLERYHLTYIITCRSIRTSMC
jgi:hypothetical protein